MAQHRAPRQATWLRRAVIALGVAVFLYLVWMIWDYDAVMRWVERARPLPFFIALALLPAIGVPMTPLFLLAGATFGAKLGLLGAAVALAANLTLCYWIGRSGLRRHLVKLLCRFGYALPDFDAVAAGGSLRRTVRFTVLFKLAPGIPGSIKHYGLGAARVPFGIYLAIAMVISGTYAALLIVAGDSLFAHELDRGVIALLVVAVLALALWQWQKRRRLPALA